MTRLAKTARTSTSNSPHEALSREQYSFIDEEMTKDDELTARKMRQLLEERWPETIVSISTVKRARNISAG